VYTSKLGEANGMQMQGGWRGSHPGGGDEIPLLPVSGRRAQAGPTAPAARRPAPRGHGGSACAAHNYTPGSYGARGADRPTRGRDGYRHRHARRPRVARFYP